MFPPILFQIYEHDYAFAPRSFTVHVVHAVSNSVKQDAASEAGRTSRKETPYMLPKQKFYYRVPNVLSQMNPNRNFKACLFKIYLNIILPSTHRSSKWPFPSMFTNNFFCFVYLLALRLISTSLTLLPQNYFMTEVVFF